MQAGIPVIAHELRTAGFPQIRRSLGVSSPRQLPGQPPRQSTRVAHPISTKSKAASLRRSALSSRSRGKGADRHSTLSVLFQQAAWRFRRSFGVWTNPITFQYQASLNSVRIDQRHQTGRRSDAGPQLSSCVSGSAPAAFTSPSEKLVCRSFTLGRCSRTSRANCEKASRSRATTCNSKVPVPLM